MRTTSGGAEQRNIYTRMPRNNIQRVLITHVCHTYTHTKTKYYSIPPPCSPSGTPHEPSVSLRNHNVRARHDTTTTHAGHPMPRAERLPSRNATNAHALLSARRRATNPRVALRHLRRRCEMPRRRPKVSGLPPPT